ncbi:phage major capsid protein [Tardiphaga sp. 215_C5_N2_1]|uniref:phage major capsid protein n=1 Tax=Tardiphaga sp. 215_C5_N2_1 TaxID=3240774 RepID=UPI003F8B6027
MPMAHEATDFDVNDALDTLTKTTTSAFDTLTTRLDKLEAKARRPAAANDNFYPVAANDNEAPTEAKSFNSYLRRGDNGVGADEAKMLRAGVAPQGGYLAPNEFRTEFIRDLTLFSPIRALATVKQTSHGSVTLQKRTGITNAKWKGEIEAQEESGPSFGQVEIVARELTTYVDVSNQLLADAVVDVDAEVRLALAEDFGQKEGLAFVKGDGVSQPAGIMSDASVSYIANGHATNLSADALIGLVYSLPAFYRNRGTFVLNGSTLAAIRKLKDTTGQYLWQPAYQAGQPETILGRPVAEAVDMDDVASGTFPVLFGDIATAYRIVDRTDLSVLVNPYLLATNSVTRMHASRRVGGGVVQANAVKKLRMTTS